MRAILSVALAGIVLSNLWAQESATGAGASVRKGRLPPIVERAVSTQGSRFRSSGLERWAAQGDFKSGAGAVLIKGIQVTMEWPGKLRISGPGGSVVRTPGGIVRGNVNEDFLVVAEMLLEDTLDGFLAAELEGAALRTIGTGYPDPVRAKSAVNVVSLMFPSRVKNKQAPEVKLYGFDSATGFLVKVTHRDAGVDVRFSDWVTLSGNQFPQTVQMLRRGTVQYTLSLTPTMVGGKQEDGLFATP